MNLEHAINSIKNLVLKTLGLLLGNFTKKTG
jgi:hypothetical protein